MKAVAANNLRVASDRLSHLGLPPEPAGYVEGANLYQFVGSNPLILVDPTGRSPSLPDWWDDEFGVPYNDWQSWFRSRFPEDFWPSDLGTQCLNDSVADLGYWVDITGTLIPKDHLIGPPPASPPPPPAPPEGPSPQGGIISGEVKNLLSLRKPSFWTLLWAIFHADDCNNEPYDDNPNADPNLPHPPPTTSPSPK
jgi:hypothetical protein